MLRTINVAVFWERKGIKENDWQGVKHTEFATSIVDPHIY